MGLRDLSVQVMVSVSEPWLNPKKDRGLLESMPVIASLLPTVEKAHKGLIANQTAANSYDSSLDELKNKAAEVDAVHDRKIRGIYSVLEGYAELADSPEESNGFLTLRDRLLPDGLSATRRSYEEEAAEAKLLPGRLDDDTRSRLRAIPIPSGNLYDAVQDWMKTAAELGSLEHQRSELEAQMGSDQTVTPMDAHQARLAWMRAVRALDSCLELDPDLDDATRDRLLGRLHRALEKAGRRGAKSAPANNGNSAPTTGTTAAASTGTTPAATPAAAPAAPAANASPKPPTQTP